MADFNHKQPTPQSNTSTEASARENTGEPKSGVVEAPKGGGKANFHEGQGVGNSRRGIH